MKKSNEKWMGKGKGEHRMNEKENIWVIGLRKRRRYCRAGKEKEKS